MADGPTVFKAGTYTFVCKIIEVKDLVAKDLNGTSDPACYIQVGGGRKQFTTTKHGVLAAVFEEDIELEIELEVEDIESTVCRIAVVDADISTAVSTDMIGCYEFNLKELYEQPDHGYDRQWIGLINMDKPQDCNKVQGFCKLNLSMLAPGDKQKAEVLDQQAQMLAEAKAEAMAGGVGSMVLMPQVIQKEQYWLSCRIHAIDGISGMDSSTFGGGSSTNVILSLAFGTDPLHTGKPFFIESNPVQVACSKAARGDVFDRSQQAKYVGQEIRLPVWLPNSTKTMRIGLWDHDTLGSNDCLGHEFVSLRFKPQEKSSIGRVTQGTEFCFFHEGQEELEDATWVNLNNNEPTESTPKWINFYGCNPKSGGLKETVKKIKGAFHKGKLHDEKEYQNKFPDAGVCYKGRTLVSFSLEPVDPPKKKKKGVGSAVASLMLGKGKALKLPEVINPLKCGKRGPPANSTTPSKEQLPQFMKTKVYHLRMMLVAGTEIPFAGENISVMVSVGKYELHSAPVGNHNGYCEWNHLYDSNDKKGGGKIELPDDITQVPDIFVYLINNRTKSPFSFRRFSADELLNGNTKPGQKRVSDMDGQDDDGQDLIGNFGDTTQWITMREDEGQDQLDDGTFPGMLLMRLGFAEYIAEDDDGLDDATRVRLEERNLAEKSWKEDIRTMMIGPKDSRCIDVQARVHLYQARRLPPADPDGSIDPYFKCKLKQTAAKKHFSIQENTTDPLFYETRLFDLKLRPTPPKAQSKTKFDPGAPSPPFAHVVILTLFDDDPLADDKMGIAIVPIDPTQISHGYEESMRGESSTANGPPTPKWYDIFKQVPGDLIPVDHSPPGRPRKVPASPQVLVSVELIPREKVTDASKLLEGTKKNPTNEAIKPAFRDAFIEVVAMGCEDLLPYQLLPPQFPMVEFRCPTADKTVKVMTKQSSSPSGTNPNFLQRIIIPCKLPENALYAPALTIRAVDTRMGMKCALGSGRFPLDNSLEWCEHEYEVPSPVKILAKIDMEKSLKKKFKATPGLYEDLYPTLYFMPRAMEATVMAIIRKQSKDGTGNVGKEISTGFRYFRFRPIKVRNKGSGGGAVEATRCKISQLQFYHESKLVTSTGRPCTEKDENEKRNILRVSCEKDAAWTADPEGIPYTGDDGDPKRKLQGRYHVKDRKYFDYDCSLGAFNSKGDSNLSSILSTEIYMDKETGKNNLNMGWSMLDEADEIDEPDELDGVRLGAAITIDLGEPKNVDSYRFSTAPTHSIAKQTNALIAAHEKKKKALLEEELKDETEDAAEINRQLNTGMAASMQHPKAKELHEKLKSIDAVHEEELLSIAGDSHPDDSHPAVELTGPIKGTKKSSKVGGTPVKSGAVENMLDSVDSVNAARPKEYYEALHATGCECDPVQWIIEASVEGMHNWVVLHDQADSDTSTPFARGTGILDRNMAKKMRDAKFSKMKATGGSTMKHQMKGVDGLPGGWGSRFGMGKKEGESQGGLDKADAQGIKMFEAAMKAVGGSEPAYMKNRLQGDEYEDRLNPLMFEDINLYRGSVENLQHVGTFKCTIRVISDRDDKPLFPYDPWLLMSESERTAAGKKLTDDGKDIRQRLGPDLFNPAEYNIRLYLLSGNHLKNKDFNAGHGLAQAQSDPYFKVKLGRVEINDRKHYKNDASDVDWFRCYEFEKVKLPGTGALHISAWDYNFVGGGMLDNLIGETVVDCTDRLFDPRWQQEGKEFEKIDPSNPANSRFRPVPIESRSLTAPPNTQAEQGQVTLWVDIMPSSDAATFPVVPVEQPASIPFELRVIIWSAKDCIKSDVLSGMNDLYCKVQLQTAPDKFLEQVTDTHWRCKGTGSFNWRMRFPISLTPRGFIMTHPNLTLQLWDKDVTKWNDMIAEKKLTLGLGAILLRAYTYGTSVQYFTPPGQAKQSKKMYEKIEGALKNRALWIAHPELKKKKKSDEDADKHAAAKDAKGSAEGVTVIGDSDFTLAKAMKDYKDNLSPTTPFELVRAFIKKYKLEDQVKVTGGGESTSKRGANDLKSKMGIGHLNPMNSEWVQTYASVLDKQGNKKKGGKVLMSIEIVPEQLAKQQNLGLGRRSPNQDPFCPRPTGRMTFSLNPFSMLRQLMGDGLFMKSLCLLCCCGLTIIIIMQLPTILTIMGTSVVKSWFGWSR
jgi:hypothetical protein